MSEVVKMGFEPDRQVVKLGMEPRRPKAHPNKGGKRPDLDSAYFRSGWEANYARYLTFIGTAWEHEPREFNFPGRATRHYLPDFYLPDEDRWIEVKGLFTAKGKTQLRRFKEYHPEEFAKLTVVIADPYSNGKQAKKNMKFLMVDLALPIRRINSYNAIAAQFRKLIPGWED